PVPLLKRVLKPPFTWEDAEPGFVFPALEYTITRAALNHFLSLAGNCGLQELQLQHDAVPVMFFSDEPMQCVGTLFQKAGRFHVGQKAEGLMAVPVGAVVRSRAVIEDRFTKSIGQLVSIACTTSIVAGGDELPAVRTTATLVL